MKQNNRLHKYLDKTIKNIIDHGIINCLDNIGLDYFQYININVIKDEYFDNDLICISISGEDGFHYNNHIDTLVLRIKDIENEFENIQDVYDYIYKPLKEYNDKLTEETEESL